jgi:hypothetical protein
VDDDTRTTLQALFDGDPRVGIVGVTGAARPRGQWDVAASARAPGLPGADLTFVALLDGTLIVDENIPDGTAAPLADAVEEYLEPPYRAAALRKDDEVWAVAAARVTLLELASVDGETLEAARIGDGVTFSVDGAPSLVPLEIRGVLDRYEGDVAVTAERIDDRTWVAEVWHL